MRSKILLASALLISVGAQASQYVFPKDGQTAEQQEMDEFTCHKWAVEQTGYNPQTTQAAAPAESTPGSGLRGAARGAIAGAVIADVGGNDTSNGASKGAAVGLLAARSGSRKANQAKENNTAQQQANSQNKTAEYKKATSACLEGKGYSVK